MPSPSPVALEALAKVKGRPHVLDILYDLVDGLCSDGAFDKVDAICEEFCSPEYEPWFLVGLLTATFEFKNRLIRSTKLYLVTYEAIGQKQGFRIADRTMYGLE